jgi:hypothetical protein
MSGRLAAKGRVQHPRPVGILVARFATGVSPTRHAVMVTECRRVAKSTRKAAASGSPDVLVSSVLSEARDHPFNPHRDSDA